MGNGSGVDVGLTGVWVAGMGVMVGRLVGVGEGGKVGRAVGGGGVIRSVGVGAGVWVMVGSASAVVGAGASAAQAESKKAKTRIANPKFFLFIFHLCNLSGFDVENDIVRPTGSVIIKISDFCVR